MWGEPLRPAVDLVAVQGRVGPGPEKGAEENQAGQEKATDGQSLRPAVVGDLLKGGETHVVAEHVRENAGSEVTYVNTNTKF